MARTVLRYGVDFVKTSASGGGGTDSEAPDIRNMVQQELDAIVDEAHAFDATCSCHCFTPTAIKMAIKAGVDTVEHVVFMDDEATQMLVDSQTPVVPTLLHRSDHALEIRSKCGTSQFTMDKMRDLQPFTEASFKHYHKSGVKIAMGTDTQIDAAMGENAMELEIYVNFGMSPMEAIMTATKNAAEAIKLHKICGTLEAGKFADIIAIDGDPLKDIRVLQEREKIAIVMKEGRIWVDRRPGYPAKSVVNDQSYGWKKLF
jgi:imidazolonepropionase-like amidohydrolase